jgi:RNA polymerase-binding transcription factor DksA
MEERDKHKLEGLLKARSQVMRQGRRPRHRRAVPDDPTWRAPDEMSGAAADPGRRCAECGEEIAPRRVRAMPRATRCLECQRAAEAAAARS